ncbi:hypothetical protein QTP70_032165 [Hemibagrus guttatus]|uniref:ribonuclease H n=1 Tax=Hemibagrus guttatus TaxID=175788 RepID=A0AAE0V1E9_9TELE|nr:hypothetical protein QTP70_032165 [Hemibagrus guttatus]
MTHSSGRGPPKTGSPLHLPRFLLSRAVSHLRLLGQADRKSHRLPSFAQGDTVMMTCCCCPSCGAENKLYLQYKKRKEETEEALSVYIRRRLSEVDFFLVLMRIYYDNSESESDSDDRFKAHTRRLLKLQSILRRAPSYRTLELQLIEWQERELFEYFVVVSLKKKPTKNSYTPEVSYQFPKLERPTKQMREAEHRLKAIPQFCFPDAKDWSPVSEYSSETFSFMLTGEDGSRRFGYCRRLLPSGKGQRLPEVYCVISRLGCFDLFSKILDEVERRRGISAALVYPFMRSLMESPFPAPGKTIKVKTFLPGAGNEVMELRRPMDSRLEHVDFESLFSCLSVRQVVCVFASLLLERRVIFIADKLSVSDDESWSLPLCRSEINPSAPVSHEDSTEGLIRGHISEPHPLWHHDDLDVEGSALSPFLFAMVMDQLSEEVRQESPWTMMFADDIVICSESREQVEENLERWRFALERRGMKVSGSKTEYMCVNEREGSGTVRLQGEEVKKVQEFKYLGSTVQSNGECGKDVKKRVQAGWNGWRKVWGVLCDRKISARIKGKVYRTVVRPAMLYGLETVSLRKRQESELEVAELKMLSVLSSCAHAVVALLYPFSWQHTFIPVLPSSMVDIVCCPTPFLVGILSSSLPKLKELPVEEALMVHLGTDRFIRQLDDEASLLPRKLQAGLEQALEQRNHIIDQDSDSESDDECNTLNSVVSEAFIRFFLETIGHYSFFLTQGERGERVFQREPFRKSVASKSIRRFLGVFMESQMFTGFIQDRELRKTRAKGLFEQRAEQYLEELPDTEQSGVNKFLKGLGNKMKFLHKKN